MTDADTSESIGTAREGLASLYAGLIDSVGLTGREIAMLSGTRPQYISDIRRRQRPLSNEMFLRTLGGLYGKYKWLISGDLQVDTRRIIALYPAIADSDGPLMPLPLFQRPFLGPKMAAGDWDGAFIRVASPVKERAAAMRHPYVLSLPFNDRSGRLKKGDYLLVDQADRADAGYILINNGWGVKLLRRVDGGFEDVESADRYPDAGITCIGSVSILLMGML